MDFQFKKLKKLNLYASILHFISGVRDILFHICLFQHFALNQYLQYKRIGKWSDYLYGEKMYILLSFVAKSLLAWQVFAGTLRP